MIGSNKRSYIYGFFLKKLEGTILHPQWLSDRYHYQSRRLLEHIEMGCVVDIGSGDSDHSKFLMESTKLWRFDYPDTNYRYGNPPHVFADASSMPMRDGSVDSVLLLEVLEHVEQFDNVLTEIRRILKRNGALYLSAPFIYPAHDEPYDYHRFTRHGLEKDLARHGFKIEVIKQHGNSIVVALQMLNLSMLEFVAKTMKCSMLLGLLSATFSYPLCLLFNFFASPFLGITANSASVFGHFIVAKPTDKGVSH